MGKPKIVGTIYDYEHTIGKRFIPIHSLGRSNVGIIRLPIRDKLTIYILSIISVSYMSEFYIKDDKNKEYQFRIDSLTYTRTFDTNESTTVLNGTIFENLCGRPLKLLYLSDEPCSICKYFIERYNECAPRIEIKNGLELIL